jgi:hypothetical protein
MPYRKAKRPPLKGWGAAAVGITALVLTIVIATYVLTRASGTKVFRGPAIEHITAG